ncbi:hypothetical protein L227DRAFT_602682 [Lentinus tigrinus ALCF2SS1-6]|uniref:BTB domain-containing protein n=1 Tax=Lentinus tigrinus ALCF2SS1-6 TaxID=1328759 RepID=A0A5C2S0Z2_9APHY|nr:hypothetical protein L227DRAFT_602682 [Lentinus tigrinus ALCF2SS1-6]
MTSPSPPAKRPRTVDTSDEDTEPQRDESFWFEDGNIVVIAQQTAFRVHRGVLSRHSETFSGLFTLPRPAGGAYEEVIDTCPVVRVTDSPHDFKHLLHALYDGLGYMESVAEVEKYSMCASLARLGHKYELSSVFSAAMQRLRVIYTDDYEVWRTFWTTGGRSAKSLRNLYIPIEVANLFRTTEQRNLLPTVLFLCCLLPITDLLDGVRRADGTLEQLSREDLRRCLEARDTYHLKLAHFWAQPWRGQPNSPPRCIEWDRCARFIDTTRSFALDKPLRAPRNVFAATMTSDLLAKDARHAARICEACADRIADEARKLFEAQWDALPETMDLTDVVIDWRSAVSP